MCPGGKVYFLKGTNLNEFDNLRNGSLNSFKKYKVSATCVVFHMTDSNVLMLTHTCKQGNILTWTKTEW